MVNSQQVDELLSRWEAKREEGIQVTLEELCAGNPELLPEVRRKIQALEELDFVLASAVPRDTMSATGEDGPVGAALPSIPGYEILSELGRGGMGVVYKARQLKLKRTVAIKMIVAGPQACARDVARFRAEAEAIAAFAHPNIVPVYEAGEHEGRTYFAMEYVAGGSLAARLTLGTLAAADAARLVETLAQAIVHAHSQGIVHRDLKPGNILLQRVASSQRPVASREESRQASATDDWLLATGYSPKIADFGLAKQLGTESGQTQTGAILGTPSYMAPEQASDRGVEVGPAADLYALGAILYECLTGRPPFRAATVLQTLEQVQTREPVPPSRLQPGVPRDLETICLKCLEKEPARRYVDGRALAEDLRSFLNGEPIRARRVSLFERGRKWAKRKPTAAALVAVGLLAISALAFAGLWHTYRLREDRAASLVRALISADTTVVPAILREIDEDRATVNPLLIQALDKHPATSRARLHLGMALLPVDSDQVEFLYGRLLTAQPDEVVVLRDALWDHRATVTPRLWTSLLGEPEAGAQLRSACVLAAFDPHDRRWSEAAPRLVAALLRENPLLLGRWIEALRPVRHAFLEPLADALRDAKRPEAEHFLLANLLADYGSDHPDLLSRLLPDLQARSFVVLLRHVKATGDATVPVLREVLSRPGTAGVAEDAQAQRQANAAVALAHLGHEDVLWPLLRHSPDPTLRTALVHALGPLQVEPAALVRRLEAETEPSVRRALVLALGEYTDPQWAGREAGAVRARLRTLLLRLYSSDSDPGMHAAAEWLLRRWGQDAELDRLNAPLVSASGRDGRHWSVDRYGQTRVVIAGPVEFWMGAPPDEPDRTDREARHRVRIPRSYALGAREVTVAQFDRFLAKHPRHGYEPPKKYAPTTDSPAIGVTWYEAAQYCRWLSEVAGVPDSEMCYPPVEEIKEGMVLPKDFLSRTGYRLPTEAEWEYACRAGATTLYASGTSEQFLAQYAAFAHPCNDPSGSLKPNDFGLFNMHGSVFEWVHERLAPYPVPSAGVVLEDRADLSLPGEQEARVIRGGSFGDVALGLRAARRIGLSPTFRGITVGFRVAQTIR